MAVTPHTSVSLRLYDGGGEFLTLLPLLGEVDVLHVLNDEGSGQLRYPITGPGAKDLLALTDGQVAVHVNGKEVFRFLPDEDEQDEADEAGLARRITIGGPGMLALLARGIVLPQDGIGAIPAINKFDDANAGDIMRRLISHMQTRGYLSQVRMSFTDTVDSAGAAWDPHMDIEYDAGKDLLTVVKDLTAQGMCDVRMRGTTLDLYNPNTVLGVDRPSIYVRRAHVVTAPRKRSRRNLRTDFLVVGDEGANILRFDQAARDKFGRRIGYVGQGSTVSSDVLARVGDQSLAENARPSRGYTLDLRLQTESCPQPYEDFQLGDAIRCDYATREEDGGYEPLRVRSITTQLGQDGFTKASLELNDRFLEAILDLSRRVEGIRHGKVGTSTKPPSAGDDTSPPPAPTSRPLMQNRVSYSPEGNAQAALLATWDHVGQGIPDFAHYDVRYQLLDQDQMGVEETVPEEQPDDPTPGDGEEGGGADPGEEGGVDPGTGDESDFVNDGLPDAAPGTYFEDEFARPDSGLIGNGWQQNGGDYNIVGGAARTTTGSTSLMRHFARRDQNVATRVTASSGTPGVLAWATQDQGNVTGYFAQINLTSVGTNVTLRRDGVQVAAVHVGPAGKALGSGTHEIAMFVRGRVVTVNVNGVQAIAFTDGGEQPTGGSAGVSTGLQADTRFERVTIADPGAAPTGATNPFALRAAEGEEPPPAEEPDPAFTSAGQTVEPRILITGLPLNERIRVDVRTVDTSGNASEWVEGPVHRTSNGVGPPPAPEAPSVGTRLGGVVIDWPRLAEGGQALPPDFAEVEIHVSTAGPDFTPTSATMRGQMIGTTGFVSGLTFGITHYVRLIMVDYLGNRSEPTASQAVIPSPLVDAELKDLDGRKLSPGTVGTTKLVVGALGNNLLANGGFEEVLDDGVRPAAWVGSATTIESTTVLPHSGSRCLRMRPFAGRTYAELNSIMVPVSGSGLYYTAGWFRGVTGQSAIYVNWYDESRTYIGQDVVPAEPVTGAWNRVNKILEAPASARFMLMIPQVNLVSSTQDSFVDDLEFRQAVGEAQIVDASIIRAKIARAAVGTAEIEDLAVGDAKIRSLGVDKLVAGELRATYVVVSGRLTTRTGGQTDGSRVEFDGTGIRAYNGQGIPTVRIGVDGDPFFQGTIGSGTEITAPRIRGAEIIGGSIRTAEGGQRTEIGENVLGVRFHTQVPLTIAPTVYGGFREDLGSSQVVIFGGDTGDATQSYLEVASGNAGYFYFTSRNGTNRLYSEPGGSHIVYHAPAGHHFTGGRIFENGATLYTTSNPPPVNNNLAGAYIGNAYLDRAALYIAGFTDSNHVLAMTGGVSDDGPYLRGYARVEFLNAWGRHAYLYRDEFHVTHLFYTRITNLSARETKHDIEPQDRGLDAIRQLRPVKYREKRKPTAEGWMPPEGPLLASFVAEDVEQLMPEAVRRDAETGLMGYDPNYVTTALVNAVQELTGRLEALEGATKPKPGR